MLYNSKLHVLRSPLERKRNYSNRLIQVTEHSIRPILDGILLPKTTAAMAKRIRYLTNARKLENTGMPRQNLFLALLTYFLQGFDDPLSFYASASEMTWGSRLLFALPETLLELALSFSTVPCHPCRFSSSSRYRRAKYLARRWKTEDGFRREGRGIAAWQRKRDPRSKKIDEQTDANHRLKAERKWQKFSDRHCGG